MSKQKSPYSAAVTGGGFLFEEMNLLLPILMSEDRDKLLKDEVLNNNILHINSEKSRRNNVLEIMRRYDAMSPSFWNDYTEMSEDDQRIALLYVILKTYKILFDFHVNVTMKKWASVSQSVEKQDLVMEIHEIAAKDDFVDSWSDATKGKIASAYLSMLRKAGMMNREGQLCSIKPSNADFYLRIGEQWFLEACLLAPYQIDNIKKQMS